VKKAKAEAEAKGKEKWFPVYHVKCDACPVHPEK